MAERVKQVYGHLTRPDRRPMSELWKNVPLAPQDGLFAISAACKADTHPGKIDLGVGAYRDDNNKPWVLPVVIKATEILLNDPAVDHEYLPFIGMPEYISAAARLILSPQSLALNEGRVVSVQTISGTGANHLGALFLSRFYSFNGPKQVYLSDPTWINHFAVFRNVGIDPVTYPYYDPTTVGLNFNGFLNALQAAPERSVFLLHACAHNPTGVDPTEDQWRQFADVFLEKGHFAFFDCAYQGFASGDLDRDARSVRHFEAHGVPMLVCQSFSKNAGLYGERVGALHIVGADCDGVARIRSQLSLLQRSEIGNPPAHGARLITLILNNPELFEEWKRDIKTMAHRIISLRHHLYDILTNELKTPGKWDHIVKQIGMFCFTGLNPEQSIALAEKAHTYLASNGRISMAGLNSHNLRYFAENLDKVVRGTL